MQTLNDLGWSTFLGTFLALNLLFFAPIVFVFYQSKLESSVRRGTYWLLWIFSFLVIPRLLFFILPGIAAEGVLFVSQKVSFGSFYSVEIFFLDSIIVLVLMFWIIRLTTLQNQSGKFTLWLRNISFFKLAIFVVALLSLIMPLISTNFQKISADFNIGEVVLIYIASVPQIFIIYFSYYIFYYLNHNYLFKFIFEKKGIFPYVVSMIGMVLILTPILNSFFQLFPVIYKLRIHPLGIGINLFDDINYIFPVLVVLASFPIIVLIEWNRKSIAITELEKQKSAAELSLLKQQINPHFFFNTLNNLYALSLEKSDQAPVTILKLSKLMRFVIYKGQQDKVCLEEEIQYLHDYIDLQKIRMRKDFEVKFEVDVEDEKIEIPPLLFINLVENAFKHGIEPSEKSSFLYLSLTEKMGQITFDCRNSLEHELTSKTEEGFGIQNLQKRLEIRFPERHSLELSSSKGTFAAILKIDL
jgi:hypothetical protein